MVYNKEEVVESTQQTELIVRGRGSRRYIYYQVSASQPGRAFNQLMSYINWYDQEEGICWTFSQDWNSSSSEMIGVNHNEVLLWA